MSSITNPSPSAQVKSADSGRSAKILSIVSLAVLAAVLIAGGIFGFLATQKITELESQIVVLETQTANLEKATGGTVDWTYSEVEKLRGCVNTFMDSIDLVNGYRYYYCDGPGLPTLPIPGYDANSD